MSQCQALNIDREKARAEVRKLDRTGLRIWLDRAMDMLPDAAFPELIADYVYLHKIIADENTRPINLLQTIRKFHQESLAGKYYKDFMENSHNYMEFSRGTETFVAEHSRLVTACLRAEEEGALETAREGFGLLIDLIWEIDECRDDIVFFADDGGSWQMGIPWNRVLLAWFRSMTPIMDASEWAKTVVDAFNRFTSHQMDREFEAVREDCTGEQRAALGAHETNRRRRR